MDGDMQEFMQLFRTTAAPTDPFFFTHRHWSLAQRSSDTLVTWFKTQGFTGLRVANMDLILYVLCKYRLGWCEWPILLT